MTTDIDVAPLQKRQLADAGDVLGRAFYDDSLMTYVLPDDAQRERVLPWFMGIAAKYGLMYGDVDTTVGKVEAAAIWLPPGDAPPSTFRMARAGMIWAPFKLGMGAMSRFMTVNNVVEELHKRDVPAQHWYLMVLGVDPPRQGQGVGGALIQPVLARADAQGLPCYLETMKERNVTFYRKHGFHVLVEDDIPKGGPHFWTMLRDPQG